MESIGVDSLQLPPPLMIAGEVSGVSRDLDLAAKEEPQEERLKLEVCIALTPALDCYDTFVEMSQRVMELVPSTYVRLGSFGKSRLALAPHLTLYQCPLLLEDLARAATELSLIAKSFQVIQTDPIAYNYNSGEGSFEVLFEKTKLLSELQEQVIDKLNPYRRGLLIERDPAGKEVRASEDRYIEEYGFAESKERFKPHVTLNWIDYENGNNQSKVKNAVAEFSRIATQEGPEINVFPYLSMYVMGPQGTCCQRLVEFKLKDKPSK